MHRQWTFKKGIRSVLAALLIFLSGCTGKPETELFTKGEWIRELMKESGIQETDTGCLLNNPNHNIYLETACGYGVLHSDDEIDEGDTLDRQWLAYTLVNLTGMHTPYTGEITDIKGNPYEEEIRNSIVLLGITGTKFEPEKAVSKEEALNYLDAALQLINNRIITETKTNIKLEDGLSSITLDAPPIENEDGTWYVGTEVQEGEIVVWNDGIAYRCGKVSSIDDAGNALIEDFDLFESSEKIELSGSTGIDFCNATIIDGNGDVVQYGKRQETAEGMAVRNLSNSFTVKDWKVSLSATKNGLKAEVSRTTDDGSKIYANTSVSGVTCDYQWLSEKKSLKDVYFAVKFNTREQFGLRNTSYKRLYGDFGRIDSKDFISSAKNFFQDADHVLEKTLTIATIEVPIPYVEVISLQMNVNLNIYMSGRIEVALTQSHKLGCEVRNGVVRGFCDTDYSHSETMKATAKLSTGIQFALKMISCRLCDATLNAGVQADMTSTVHLYNEDGTRTQVNSDIPADFLDELAQLCPDVLLCTDLNAYLFTDVKLNSSSSLLGKMNMSKTINVLTSDNASLLPDGIKHMENFRFVSKCTRKDREATIKNDYVKVTGTIKLDRYALVIKENGYRTISIKGLPEGYTTDDLVYESLDTGIALVSANGRVTGKTKGSTEVVVSTSDGMHSVSISILVSDS